MKKGDATRARILEEAAKQASLRGLAAVSLNDVAEAIGLSKSGLFKHFQAKEAMQQAVLEATIDRVKEAVWVHALAKPPGRERLDELFQRFMDWDEFECGEYGCLVSSSTVEFDDQPGPIRDLLHQSQHRMFNAITRAITELRDPPLDDELARQLAFELRAYVMAFTNLRRIMPPGEARRRAWTAYRDLIARIEA